MHRLLALALLTACASDPSGTDDTTDDTVGERPATITATWSADEVNLAPGSYSSFGGGTFTPPATFGFGGDGFDLGTFRPTTAHMTYADPLKSPADGAQTYWLNTTPFGDPSAPVLGYGGLAITIVESTVAGTTYDITLAAGQRLDLTAPQAMFSLNALKPDVADPAVATAFATIPAGAWADVAMSWTADVDGVPLTLVIDVQGDLPEMQQLLIDAITATW